MRAFLPQRFIPQDLRPARSVRATCAAAAFVAGVWLPFVADANAPVSTDSTNPRPAFTAVVQALTEYFASLGDYQAGDLVCQSNVTDALAHVAARTGWKIPRHDAIVSLALPDNSFVVTQLSTPDGRKFMRNIGRFPGAYSRLDRLSTISRGKRLISDLIATKGGADLIQYLATTSGGRELGKMMADVRNGVDLNQPTGRIYTADDLLAVLKQVYAAP